MSNQLRVAKIHSILTLHERGWSCRRIANELGIHREHGVDRSYVGRMLRLTSLAPDIVEAILRADEPEGMSLEKLRKDLPVVWGEQRIWVKIE